MPTLLVTGGAGFIGASFIRLLLAESDFRVVNLDALTYAANVEAIGPGRDGPRHRLLRGDIADAAFVRAAFEAHRPFAVVHLAAESHVDRSIDAPQAFLQTNVVGTFTMLQESLRHWRGLPADEASRFRFVHVSTDEVFGSLAADEAVTEETPYDPSSPYAASKAASDHLVRAWGRTYGLPAIVTNCTNNYGPWQFPEKLIPLMIEKAIAGEPLPVYGRGENVRDWLYVDDHARALKLALERGEPGRTYGIAGGSGRRNLDVVKLLCAELDAARPSSSGPSERLITFVPDRPGHDLRYAVDDARTRRELGWSPRETLESGLRRTVAWHLEHRGWSARVRAGGYGGERLGLQGGA